MPGRTTPSSVMLTSRLAGGCAMILRRGLDAHRDAARAELALRVEAAEATGDRRAALVAVSVLGEPVIEDGVPVAHDQRFGAIRAERRAAFGVVHVARVDVVQALGLRDAPRAA